MLAVCVCVQKQFIHENEQALQRMAADYERKMATMRRQYDLELSAKEAARLTLEMVLTW